MKNTVKVVALAAILGLPSAASAQNWSFDARRIALGGAAASGNLASEMVEEEGGYHTVVLPFGLLQVMRNLDVFKPNSDQFDLVRAVEYTASPLHYIPGRGTTGTGTSFVTDIRNGRLSRDLNDYRGFIPVSQPVSEGLAAPNFGVTIPVSRREGAFQGVYVGAGPHLAFRNTATVDPELTALLGSSTPMYLPNAQLDLGSTVEGEAALAVTGGYRAHVQPWHGASERDGIYVAADYSFLRGFRYEDADVALRLDTDASGLLTYDPALGLPLAVTRDTARSGRGSAIDLGVSAVVDRWEVGFGANGVANHIDWTDVERTEYTLPNLFTGGGTFVESTPVPLGDERVELPVDYRGNVGYRAERWAAVAEAGHGFQGTSFHGGGEYQLAGLTLRGGGLYTREMWQPSAGIGVPFSRRLALDVAVFGTSANLERKRQAAIAASLRIGR